MTDQVTLFEGKDKKSNCNFLLFMK